MISINHDTINRQADNLQNKGIIHCLESYKFRCIKISGNRNQCLQYCLNAFYYDVDDLKKGTILWLVVHWDLYPVCSKNDNTFTFKRMLGYNTAFFDDIDNKWQFDRVNNLSATGYIKYSKNLYLTFNHYQFGFFRN